MINDYTEFNNFKIANYSFKPIYNLKISDKDANILDDKG